MGKHTWHRKARQTRPDTGSTKQCKTNNAGKIKRHLSEDALLNEQAPAKRLKLVPITGREKTKSTTQGPPQKRRKQTAQKNLQTIAPGQLFPELQQREIYDIEMLQNTNPQNHNAGTSIGKENQLTQDNQKTEPPQQHWAMRKVGKKQRTNMIKLQGQWGVRQSK